MFIFYVYVIYVATSGGCTCGDAQKTIPKGINLDADMLVMKVGVRVFLSASRDRSSLVVNETGTEQTD